METFLVLEDLRGFALGEAEHLQHRRVNGPMERGIQMIVDGQKGVVGLSSK